MYSPPRDVGYFGGDSDNWRWPRHSADFAFLRVYTTPSNRPAEHQASNVPYHPSKYLPSRLDQRQETSSWWQATPHARTAG